MIATAELAPAQRPTAERIGRPACLRPRLARVFDGSRSESGAPSLHNKCEPAERSDDEIVITRWRRSDAPVTIGPVVREECAMLTIALSATDATIKIDNEIVHQGRFSVSMFQLVAPGAKFEAHFRSPADFVRLYIPHSLFLQVAAHGSCLQSGPGSIGRPACEPVIEQLARSIVAARCGDHASDRGFLDAIGTALLERARSVLSTTIDGSTQASGLIAWRLKRVVDFIDARLDQPLSLADMAQAAGLSRMHFAAQFRLATGFAPHAFLTRRRIERARDLLCRTSMPLVEIALSVGFQTQAHFTTIFRQLSGQPPGRWRRAEAAYAKEPSGWCHR